MRTVAYWGKLLSGLLLWAFRFCPYCGIPLHGYCPVCRWRREHWLTAFRHRILREYEGLR